MFSIRQLYKVGNGPSSSHTIGPKKASEEFLRRYPECDRVVVKLYASLALTGKGHLTDYIIEATISPLPCKVEFDIDYVPPHPNTMEFIGFKDNKVIGTMTVYSVGGGAIKIEGDAEEVQNRIYSLTTYHDIVRYCEENSISLSEYVDMVEGEGFDDYIKYIRDVMLKSIENGLANDGFIPGKLQLKRKATYLYAKHEDDKSDEERKNVIAYAYAVAEENASGGEIVTAPTCGASGILPAVLRYAIEKNKYSEKHIHASLKIAGLIGNLVKHNGSISGAEAGCQAEVGTACSMAAAFLISLDYSSFDKIERAAEIALEHHLGLTCDPIEGYVQIPCIERNAVAAMRALDAAKLASYLINAHSKISFDLVVKTMLDTGKDLHEDYRETSEGGLARNYK